MCLLSSDDMTMSSLFVIPLCKKHAPKRNSSYSLDTDLDTASDDGSMLSDLLSMMLANNGRVGQCDTNHAVIVKSLPKEKTIGIIKLTLCLSFLSLQGEW